MNTERYIKPFIDKYLPHKMIFVAGPRQVGKTTVALSCAPVRSPAYSGYLNWDDLAGKEAIRKGRLPQLSGLLIFDEIHKFLGWRNFVKGIYDTKKGGLQIIVTGSARLDYYRRGGDSLAGRYFFVRLHPFTLGEVGIEHWGALLKFGGFPEPLFRGEEEFHRLWQRQLSQRIIHEDLRDLEQVKEIGLLETLLDLLPERVGSPLSVKSLKEDLDVAHETVTRWLKILENLYLIFSIGSYPAKKIRSVKKERKVYFWDWSRLEDSGARFENCVASHLLKYCQFEEDTKGIPTELRFIRDFDKREIDFVVLQNNRPLFAVECKSGETKTSPRIAYFKARTMIPQFYQVHMGTKDFFDPATKARVLPFTTFCREMNLP